MPTIAISYRRTDSQDITGRIYDRLVRQFDEPSVFLDVDRIPPGVDFRTHINQVWHKSDILIVVIGAHWTGPDGQGASRILSEDDPVRVEVEIALELRKTIIPVLVNKAIMPAEAALPPSLKQLPYLNALEVHAGRDFHPHVDRLIRTLNDVLGLPNPKLTGLPGTPDDPLTTPFLLSYLALPAVLLLVAYYLFVIVFNLHEINLRLAAVAIPMACGFFLLWRARQSVGVVILIGLLLGLVSIVGMQSLLVMTRDVPMLPATAEGWRTGFEFLAGIALSVIGGYLVARLLDNAGLLRAR